MKLLVFDDPSSPLCNLLSSTATLAPLMTFASTRALLAGTLLFPLNSLIAFRTNGVFLLPVAPARSARKSALSIISAMSSLGIECATGTGFANNNPELKDNDR